MLNTYLILFPEDLGDELQKVFEVAIDPFQDWARLIEKRAWVVCSEKKTSVEIRKEILSRLDSANVESHPFLIFNVTRSGWASHKVNPEIIEWLKQER